jgi:hypothetical protein
VAYEKELSSSRLILSCPNYTDIKILFSPGCWKCVNIDTLPVLSNRGNLNKTIDFIMYLLINKKIL